jgi:class 3 adenylate cyclase/tetratricopeptide (TPR) repeat protein
VGFKFCGACGAPLQLPVPAREERKVVTVLFADLVGFTSRAEKMDPEDVRALLAPYHSRLREELERFGGTVEKFIGDAVMALFGAPVAHEDDPERAVRAALAIRDWVREREEELQLRIAVNTGEALIALGARPEAGEGMASGDVVNTTARLQSAAPVNGILVGETTYRATRHTIEFAEREPVQAKGKAEPVPVWEALQARAAQGVDLLRGVHTPLVGRKRELDAVHNAFARARGERAPQLVTLVGVPGIGKSRLVYELMQLVEVEPDLVTWRQGRSLPYGEGVSFWPVAEIVKAEAGILETDSAGTASDKLRRSVDDVVGDDADWVEAHLRPIVGSGEGEGPTTDRRTEAFAAWRRFFEGLAEQDPLVLVFEDLHWADEGTLDFVDYLVDWASDVPMFVVGTARPELLERRPSWGGGKTNALTLALAPLTEQETATLIVELGGKPVLPAEAQQELLARTGGNPLYAEQFTRMLLERPDGDGLALPESVQGIIAARLDALRPEEKQLLHDAAVIGKVFWTGAAAMLGGVDRGGAEDLLHALERKEFVQRARRASVASETEYSFRHVLVRDVAYGQIPRAGRADKHRRAAEWIESLPRPDDHAEMVAHHYATALEYARASGTDVSELETRARLAFREAGDRASRLNAVVGAARFYEAALELWPRGDPERPELLLRFGKARYEDTNLDEQALEEAHDGFVAAGNRGAAAEAKVVLANVWWVRGRQDRVRENLTRALELVRDDEASPSKAYVLTNASRFAMLAGDFEQAIAVGSEAIRMAEELALEEVRGVALSKVGTARALSGDDRGLEELERSFEILSGINSVESWGALLNLGAMYFERGDLAQAWSVQERSRALVERFGYEGGIRWERGERPVHLYFVGRWDEAAAFADDFISESEAGAQHYLESICRDVRGRIRFARGDLDGAGEDAVKQLELARHSGDPQVLQSAFSFRAWMLLAEGRQDEAGELADELLATWREIGPRGVSAAVEMAWILRAVRREPEYLELLERQARLTRWFEAGRCVASGDLVGAADLCAQIGSLPDEAYARLRAAEALLADGRRHEADEQLGRAFAFFRSVGATRYIREGEALLAAAS